MTVKELIELLQKYPDDTPVLREYDDSFDKIEVKATRLYSHQEYNPRYGIYWNDTFPPTIEDVVIIHSGYCYDTLENPNRVRVPLTQTELNEIPLMIEKAIPKIKDLFERDNKFYSNLDKKK